MRRPFAVLICSCLILFCLSTRALAQPAVSFGFQGGLNFADASTSPNYESISSRTGAMFGAQFEVALSDFLSIQPELFDIQKGAVFSGTTEGASGRSTWKIDYAELVILLKAKFGSTQFKPFVFAGPNIGIKTNAEAVVELGTLSETTDLKDKIESTDIALDFGIGGEYQMDSTAALVGSIRYSHGFSDINKDNTASWKSYGVQVVVGVKFSL
jgi:hypothetical protein